MRYCVLGFATVSRLQSVRDRKTVVRMAPDSSVAIAYGEVVSLLDHEVVR